MADFREGWPFCPIREQLRKGQSWIGLKFKPKLSSKFVLKGSKTIEIMKGSKNRGINTSKSYMLFAYIETRNIDILWKQGNLRYRILFLTVVYVLSMAVKQYSQENTCVGVCFRLCWSPCNFIKKRLQLRCFPVNIADVLRTTIIQNSSRRLLLEGESENISQWWQNVLSRKLSAFCTLCTLYLMDFGICFIQIVLWDILLKVIC